MRFRPYIFSLSVATAVLADTNIGGEVSGFLTVEKSPYIVTETIVVNEGKALAIAEGAKVLFNKNTGIDVRGGSFAIVGDENSKVELLPNATTDSWNGISITGNESADISFANIEGAINAIAVENGSASIRNVSIKKATTAVSAKYSKLKIQNSNIQNSVTAANVNASTVSIEASELKNNHVAVFASKESDVTLTSTKIEGNDYGVLDQGYNYIREHASSVQNNKVGIVATDIPLKNLKSAAQNNEKNVMPGADSLAKSLAPIQENAFAERYRQYDLQNGDADTSWSLSGNIAAFVGYHLVRTRHDHSTGERYDNFFQTPGTFGGLNAFMKLEAPTGESLEFTADLYSDRWNYINVRTINVTYLDEVQKLSLGDTYIKGGDLYLAGINMLGGSYSRKLLQTSAGMPMFEVLAFGGETQAPKILGNRDKENYKDWVEEDDITAQEITAGGSIKWNMHRRFNGTLGFIGSKDILDDPILRDGMSESHETVDPMVTSKTFFADGNWLFWPGDIELNGQVAAGAADTSNVHRQRAINEVFNKAGISISNYALLRRLMKNPNLVSTLKNEELVEIFGDSQAMTSSEMRNVLRKLLDEAKAAERKLTESKDDQNKIQEWDAQNLAAMGSLRWQIAKTTITAELKIIGSKFYSAGSPDALNNYRSFNLGIDQKILDFWKISMLYNGYVENASKEKKYNILGLYEGTTVGLFQKPSDKWKKEHELDMDRAVSAHNASIENVVTLGDFTLSLRYKSDFKKRHRPTRLYANYSAESGIYEDAWFKPEQGSKSIPVVNGDDTVFVDAGKFEKYYEFANDEYLASDFEERILRHFFKAEIAWKLPQNTLKIGGEWIFRNDMSRFSDDDNLDFFDFSDKTYGILGYYFHGADFFEQKYPISLNTDLDIFKNTIAFTPRYKKYNRDSMKEIEWTLNENLEIPLSKDFLELSLNGEFRQEFIRRHQDGKNEKEADLDGSATLRVHYTKDWFSDYTLGAYYAYRPDSRADEYKDFYGMFTLNYAF